MDIFLIISYNKNILLDKIFNPHYIKKKKYPSYYSKNCVMHPNLFKITFIKTYTFEEFYRYKRPLTRRKTVQYFFQIHSYLLQLLTEKIPRKTDASKACARLKKPCDLG